MANSEVVENLIIGSGLAGIATGKALGERQVPFEVLDVGYDLEPATERVVAQLADQDPSGWDGDATSRLFPSPPSSAKGVDRRLLFGSDFPYRVPNVLSVKTENCSTELTHGLGGLGNVWGAAMLPYDDRSLRNWPISKDELEESYRNVLRYVPLSAEKDGLEETFPLHSDRVTTLDRGEQIDTLLTAFDQRRESLLAKGIQFGRARVAVNSTGDAATCRYCGHCLDGCVYDSIFNPRLHWKQAQNAKDPVHKGYYALEFKEHDDHVLVTAVNTKDHSIKEWRTRRLFLAAGHFATARMIARSLGRLNEPIRILDSQYFFFPLLAYRGADGETKFTLADAFIEIFNEQLNKNHMHFQIYGMNDIFKRTLRSLVPRPLPIGPATRRFFIFQGFLHSDDSGHLEMTITSTAAKQDQVLIRGVENPGALRMAKRAQALLRKSLMGVGLISPFYLQLVPPGRSFHTGGSFPMGGAHNVYSSDVLGRPAGLKRVHIVDSANFPDVASSTIGLTIMANADRITRACAKL